MSYTYHKAILHIDGDAFFASCEQSTNLPLRNKPIAVGYERGCATAYSYEAKTLGVTRGMSTKELIRKFPSVILVNSDYRKYGIFSARMKSIVLCYTSRIEKTSIDECFVDVTGLDVIYECTYQELARRIQKDLCTKLGMTFSIGLAPTKTLAKLASGMNKPHGITVVDAEMYEKHILKTPIEYVGGIGYRTAPKLHQLGIRTIGEFIQKDHTWIQNNLSKPYKELHRELCGYYTKELVYENAPPKSISKIHAFESPTNNQEFLLQELSYNIEVVCKKLRRYKLGTLEISCGLKTFDEMKYSHRLRLATAVAEPGELYKHVTKLFYEIYQSHKKYRATYVCVSALVPEQGQIQLFTEEVHSRELFNTVDELEKRYGTQTIGLLSSCRHTNKRSSSLGTPLVSTREISKVLIYPEIVYTSQK